MTGIILEDVSVDFPLYGSHRSLRKVIFERAAGRRSERTIVAAHCARCRCSYARATASA